MYVVFFLTRACAAAAAAADALLLCVFTRGVCLCSLALRRVCMHVYVHVPGDALARRRRAEKNEKCHSMEAFLVRGDVRLSVPAK